MLTNNTKGKSMMQTPAIHGSARIGRSGTKLHPAVKEGRQIRFTCRCPNTQNGHAANHSQFFTGIASNCGK
jgi:hypothetical protein